jgi:hypothetical protein
MLILFAARTIDVGVYHRMLRGAVKFNELFEDDLQKAWKWRTGLTECISAYSRFDDPKLLGQRDVNGRIWSGKKLSFAKWRIDAFYIISIAGLALAATFLIVSDNTS